MKKVNVLKHISDKLSPEQIKFANNEIQTLLHPLILKYENKISFIETPFEINEKGKNPLIEKLKFNSNRDHELCKVFIYSDHHYENDLNTKNILKSLLYRNTTFLYSYFEKDSPEPIHISYFDFHSGAVKVDIPSDKYQIRPSEKRCMKKNEVNIEFLNDKEQCYELFNAVPNRLKPAWLAIVLTYFDDYLKEVPEVVAELIQIIDDENSWHKAKNQVYKIAKYRIKSQEISIENYLRFAEKVAEITDDILNNRNNFDKKRCNELIQLANEAGQYCSENHFIMYDLESGFTLLRGEVELEKLIQTTEDYRIFRKIDHVVCHDWDPLNLNKIWFRHEYLSYIPTIFTMIKNNESVRVIAKHLQKLDKKQFNYKRKSYKELKRIARLMKA